MRQILITLLIPFTLIASGCQPKKMAINPQENDEWGVLDSFDFSLTKDSSYVRDLKRGNWIINLWETVYSNNEKGLSSIEYAPAEYFYHVEKRYYPDGTINEKIKIMCGVWIEREYFYADGRVLKRDFEAKSSGETILKLLENEGWFNRQTGNMKIVHIERDSLGQPYCVEKGVKKLQQDGCFYKEISRYIDMIYYGLPLRPSPTDHPYWYVMIRSHDGKTFVGDWRDGSLNGEEFFYYVVYKINGDTGEYTKEIKERNTIIY
ncbi:MAG: hypothetical protein LBV72_07515 [Tannerella sp.]|jgi:hypothetical protein|nr:hypothetical protein [Tannerella sp.]